MSSRELWLLLRNLKFPCTFSLFTLHVLFPFSGSKKKTKLLVLSLSLVIGVAVVGLTIGLYTWTKKNKRKLNLKDDDLDLPLFALSTITKATSNFSAENKLGEGGFGSVYKVTF